MSSISSMSVTPSPSSSTSPSSFVGSSVCSEVGLEDHELVGLLGVVRDIERELSSIRAGLAPTLSLKSASVAPKCPQHHPRSS